MVIHKSNILLRHPYKMYTVWYSLKQDTVTNKKYSQLMGI